MNLPPRTVGLKRLILKDKAVLTLDTGFDADSLEGIRLVKASRGSGWFFDGQTLRPWTTKGVLQEDRRLVVWGDLDDVPEGADPGPWPLEGPGGRDFLRAFVQAWTTRAAASDPLPGFSPTAIVPWRVGDSWAFAFLPPDLRGVLDSLVPLSERLPWEHYRHPEARAASSWAFTSAALALQVASGALPWSQPDEEHLHQELRDLKRTFSDDELPDGPDGTSLKLWSDSLTGRLGADAASRWQAWARETRSWEAGPGDPARAGRRDAAAARRQRRRSGAAFWRRKGTLVTALTAGGLALAAIIGSVVWGIVKPDPTDVWTPEQVVRGYYAALSDLETEQMRKLTSFNKDQEKDLERDETETTNLFVIRQVRTAYERKSPMTTALEWEAAGRPELQTGQMLYGVAGLEVSGAGTDWTATYRKWVSEGEEDNTVHASGASVTDRLTLVKTGRGWKVSSLRRDRQPLP